MLDAYGREHAVHTADPERIAYAMAALLPILGPLPIGSVTGEVTRRYAKTRERSPATVRRELGVLQAAANYCHAEGHLTGSVKIKLPEKTPARDRWLTRDEVAAMLRAARRNPRSRHLARFIVASVYSGTRSDSILNMRFMPHTGGGYVDTAKGVMYRRPTGTVETKKRTPPVRIPRQLLAHLRRWERNGARWVVEYEGQRVGSLKTAWKKALAAAGIEHCTKHDLRHTAITWAMQAGADKWAACGFFGVSIDMIERVYGHHHPDHMASAVEAMERRS